jgi:hypothetical protein
MQSSSTRPEEEQIKKRQQKMMIMAIKRVTRKGKEKKMIMIKLSIKWRR